MLRRRRARPEAPSHIGILVINAIGDTILSGGIEAELRQIYPQARITIFTSGANRGAAELLASSNRVVQISLARPDKTIVQLRRARLDILIDTMQWARITAVYSALSGAYTIGFKTLGQRRHFGYDAIVVHAQERHEIDNFRALLAPLGISLHGLMPQLGLPRMPTVGERQTPYVVFHPWAGGANGWRREWPQASWVELAKRVRASGYEVFVTGGPTDRRQADALVQAATLHNVSIQSVAGALRLMQTALLCQNAAAVICVNSGLMHIAACLDVPIIALHGPTDPRRWGPLSPRADVIQPSCGSYGYLHLGFEYPPGVEDCMQHISVEAVWRALALRLDDGQHDGEPTHSDTLDHRDIARWSSHDVVAFESGEIKDQRS